MYGEDLSWIMCVGGMIREKERDYKRGNIYV